MTTYHSSYRRGRKVYEVDAGDGRYVVRCQGRIVALSPGRAAMPPLLGVSDDTAMMIFAMDAVRRLSQPGNATRH
jgi:hypothetical protein